MNVSQQIGNWYDSNKRFLPWRETRNPYYIWLSEIILQQTRVNQGFAYYQRFIKRFPKLDDLASASVEDVLIEWQGLGYYSRARNLHKTAQLLSKKFSSRFPEDYALLLELPGIGEYTAGAIASLAFNKPVISIDGNVYRVLARYFGISSAFSTAKGKSDFRTAAEAILDRQNPGRHNQSLIELGALICLPFKPKCDQCPVNVKCYAYNRNQISQFPVRTRKTESTRRYFYYLIIIKKNRILFKQRDTNDIWALLYDFPLIEMKKPVSLATLLKSSEWSTLLNSSEYAVLSISKLYKHALSHQLLHIRFIELQVDESFRYPSAVEVQFENILHYPVPRLIDKYLIDRNIRQFGINLEE
jgi:A/G-specific adenine glycosylase